MAIWKQWFDSNCDKNLAIKNAIENGAYLEDKVAMEWLKNKKMYKFSPECEQQINEIHSSNRRQSPLNAIYEKIKKQQDEDYKERRGYLSRSPAEKKLTSFESKKYKKKSSKKKKSPVKKVRMSRTRC